MPVIAPDGKPRNLYLLCRNNGYDLNNPNPLAENTPDLSPPDPLVDTFFISWEMQASIYVADDVAAPGDHRHHMATPTESMVTQQIADDPHFHGSWVRNDGGQIWSTENLISGVAAAAVTSAANVPHDHEVDVQQLTNSLGEIFHIMRPKWFLVSCKVNNWTHQHITDNGGGRTIILAERPWISGDDGATVEECNALIGSWVFEDKAPNTAWDAGYRSQLESFWLSRFGRKIPETDGPGDKGVNDDRRLISWWHAANQYQLHDETRAGR